MILQNQKKGQVIGTKRDKACVTSMCKNSLILLRNQEKALF